MPNDGWIKLHRLMMDWEWYKTPFMYHLFSHLIMSANHDDGCWQGKAIKRGQLITGRKSLSLQTGISEQSIRTCLENLKKTKEISLQSTKRYTIVTICKYEEYQDQKNQANQQSTSQLTKNQPRANQELTTNKKKKNGRMEEVKDKDIYGSFKNVFLTKEEYSKLLEKFNSSLLEKIDTLSEGIASKGYKYNSHYATILAWSRKDEKRMTPMNLRRKEVVPLKEQQAREILGYGTEQRDSEAGYFDMEPVVSGSEGQGTAGSPRKNLPSIHATDVQR